MIYRYLLILVATIAGLGTGAAIVAFNRESQQQPFAFLFRATDKVEREFSALMAPADAGPPIEYHPTVFTGIDGIVVNIPREPMPGAGGAVAVIGNETLITTFRGNVYTASEDGSFFLTDIVVPDNGLEEWRSAARRPENIEFRHSFGKLRYNELEVLDRSDGRFLFLSYNEFHEDQNCHTLTVARLTLPVSGPVSGTSASPEDWEIVFRSSPCLPLRGVNDAIQGEEAGGRIAFSPDGTTAYLTVGEYGWNGWDSDGLTELSRSSLAQNPNADQGKIVEIDLATLEARHFSTGHRNAQGVTVDHEGRIWSVEHGPRGGDELNLIEDGNNYGWPVVTYGTDYNGAPIPGVQTVGYHDGYAEPVYAWLPSVGISGITALHADFHPSWDGDLLAISLNGNTLFRIRVDGERVVFTEEIEMGRRLRDIEQLENGRLVIWTDSHEVIFLSPVEGGFGEQYIGRRLERLADADPQFAEEVAEAIGQCSECHSFNSQEYRIGPPLARVHGELIGGDSLFQYSDALENASDRWDEESLTAYLRDPEAIYPGTTMANPQIGDERVIAEIVFILEELSQEDLRD